MSKLKLDLHDIFNDSRKIETALNDLIQEGLDRKIKTLEIIPGKGSGQLKKRVLRFLEDKSVKPHIQRIDKDSKNFGRIFVYLKF
jgi:DNA-nicking Smr family endonuclease